MTADMTREDLRPSPWPPLGQERYHNVYARRHGRQYVEYTYRTPEGQLFIAVLPTLAECQAARNKWLVEEVAARQRRALAERAKAEARDAESVVADDIWWDVRRMDY